MLGALFVVGSNLLKATWIGRHTPAVASGVLPLMLFLEQRRGEAYKKYRDMLDALGITEEESLRISLDEGHPDKMDIVLHAFEAEELAEMAGPAWEKYFKGFVGHRLCLLNKEVFLLEKVFESVKRLGTMDEIHFSFNVLDFSTARLNTPEFLAIAGITKEQLDEVFGERKN